MARRPEAWWPFGAQIDVDLGGGKEDAVVFGSDLTHEYVAVNADYRS